MVNLSDSADLPSVKTNEYLALSKQLEEKAKTEQVDILNQWRWVKVTRKINGIEFVVMAMTFDDAISSIPETWTPWDITILEFDINWPLDARRFSLDTVNIDNQDNLNPLYIELERPDGNIDVLENLNDTQNIFATWSYVIVIRVIWEGRTTLALRRPGSSNVVTDRTMEVTDPNTSLPVGLTSFEGYPIWKTNKVLFELANTSWFSHAVIERGVEWVVFNAIWTVSDMDWNSTTSQTWEFVDENPNSPYHTYRVKFVDQNWRFAYSDIISILNSHLEKETPHVEIFPNPARWNHINVILDTWGNLSAWTIATIYSMDGRSQRNIVVAEGSNTISLNGLFKWLHVIRLTTDNWTNVVKKFNLAR